MDCNLLNNVLNICLCTKEFYLVLVFTFLNTFCKWEIQEILSTIMWHMSILKDLLPYRYNRNDSFLCINLAIYFLSTMNRNKTRPVGQNCFKYIRSIYNYICLNFDLKLHVWGKIELGQSEDSNEMSNICFISICFTNLKTLRLLKVETT